MSGFLRYVLGASVDFLTDVEYVAREVRKNLRYALDKSHRIA